MIKKRSRFLTVMFAVVPGAGHMWNGFMKRGLSLAAPFFGLWFLADWLNISGLNILMTVMWFYAFFDCINMRFQDDQDFYAMRDDYLFSMGDVMHFTMGNRRNKLITGVVMIAMGLWILWQNVAISILYGLGLSDRMWQIIRGIEHTVPQVVAAVIIMWIGWRLIRGNQGKERTIRDEEKERAQDVEFVQVDDHARP